MQLKIEWETLIDNIHQVQKRPRYSTLHVFDANTTLQSSLGEAPGVRSGVIDLFPKDENRETEVSGFRFLFVLAFEISHLII